MCERQEGINGEAAGRKIRRDGVDEEYKDRDRCMEREGQQETKKRGGESGRKPKGV